VSSPGRPTGRPRDPARPPVTRTAARSGRACFQYGLDAPGPLVASGVAGIVAIAVGFTAVRRALWPGVVLVAYAGGHLWGSTIGKVRAARRLLGAIPWRGDEVVLDVGCGHGLFLVETARHLTTGTAVGIDVWSQKDQWRNSPAAAIENVRRARVIGRAHVHDADARHLPFPDATFDVVVSSLVIHNIPGRDDRARALQGDRSGPEAQRARAHRRPGSHGALRPATPGRRPGRRPSLDAHAAVLPDGPSRDRHLSRSPTDSPPALDRGREQNHPRSSTSRLPDRARAP